FRALRQSYAEGCKPASCRLEHRDTCGECGQTTRTFHRRFVAATGVTPAEAGQKLRCQLARSLLQTTPLNPTQIADKAGFGSESRLRRSLKRQFGVGARDLRERF